MTVKQTYKIGDTVWIYGVSPTGKSTEGKIIHEFTLEDAGWSPDIVHYVVAVPTEIEPLLEIRTWETISQTKDGNVGSIRETFANPDASRKMLSRVAIKLNSNDDEEIYPDEGDDPTPEQIHAAIERAEKARDPIFTAHATKPATKRPAKKRTFTKRKKPDATSNNS